MLLKPGRVTPNLGPCDLAEVYINGHAPDGVYYYASYGTSTSGITVVQPTQTNLKATVYQGTATNLHVEAEQATASELKCTPEQSTATSLHVEAEQTTASELNATVVQGTASSLKVEPTQTTAANLKGQIQLIDESGTAYGVKHISNKPRISSFPYLYDVAQGNVTGATSVNKFGYNPTLATSYEDVWEGSSIYTYPASAVELHCSSSDDTDTQDITVTGLDATWASQTVTQTLAGQTETVIGSGVTWMRVFQVKNAGTTDFAGTVYVYEDDTVTAGVPDTASKIRAQILGDNNQTLMALWTVPLANTAYLLDFYAATSSPKLVTVSLYIREFGGVFQLKHIESFTASRFEHKFELPLKLEAKSDVTIRAKVTVAGGDCYAGFDLWCEV